MAHVPNTTPLPRLTLAHVIQDLTTLQRNLTKAIKDRETITIGGGTFKGSELVSLLAAIENGLNEAKHQGA